MSDVSPNSPSHRIYRDPHYGFSIRVPGGWQIAVESPNGAIIPRAEARLDPVDRINPFPVYPGLVLIRGASELPVVEVVRRDDILARGWDITAPPDVLLNDMLSFLAPLPHYRILQHIPEHPFGPGYARGAATLVTFRPHTQQRVRIAYVAALVGYDQAVAVQAITSYEDWPAHGAALTSLATSCALEDERDDEGIVTWTFHWPALATRFPDIGAPDDPDNGDVDLAIDHLEALDAPPVNGRPMRLAERVRWVVASTLSTIPRQVGP